jgi:hypothetical protein
VYGGGKGINIVEGNVIWNAGEGIQVVSDAIVRNNIIFNCSVTGITATPHAAVSKVRNVRIVNNTIVNNPRGIRIRWGGAPNMIFSNNAVYCPGSTAVDASGITDVIFSANYIEGRLNGVKIDDSRFFDGASVTDAFYEQAEKNFWPKSGSLLLNNADPAYTPKLDFNNTTRKPPFDVGAYETGAQATNPGWQIQAGFKK